MQHRERKLLVACFIRFIIIYNSESMHKLLLFLFTGSLYAQIGIGTSTPNDDAILEVVSSDKGILLPRVNLISTSSSAPLLSHVAGMIVFNTAQNGTSNEIVYPGLYYNDGVSWLRLNPNTIKIGELKHSFATADHQGWYLLNGRSVTTLPAKAQGNATLLGFGATIPDGTDRFLKAKTGSESLASSGGTNYITLTQSNLPNVNFTGSTNSAGDHSHSVDSYVGTENIGLLSTTALTVFYTAAVAKESMTTAARTSQASGNHTHSVSFSSGGSSVPVDTTPQYLATNIFIYLGNN